MRLIPVDAKRSDWPRLVAAALNSVTGKTDWSALADYANDAAAAAGGVGIGELYRTASAVKVRVS